VTNGDYDGGGGGCGGCGGDEDDDDDDEIMIRKPRRILQLSVLSTPNIPSQSADILSPHSKWLEPRAISLETTALSIDHKQTLSIKACADRQGRLHATTIGRS
jgi:hypothetical protein